MPKCQLVSKESHAPVPVREVNINATVKDFLASVTVNQKYQNDEAKPLEVLYMFPVELHAVIHKLEVRAWDRRIYSYSFIACWFVRRTILLIVHSERIRSRSK